MKDNLKTYEKRKEWKEDMSYENETSVKRDGVCITAAMKEDRGELDLTRQLEEKDKLIQELRMRIRDMLLISEQHRSILGDEITDRKRLEKEVKDLKVQMSEYLSVRVKGARDNAS